jgi:uncharacterized HAD superfamily protein
MIDMPYKIIGIDLDDVLLNFNENFFIYHNDKYGTNHQRKDSIDYQLENILRTTKEEAVKRVLDFYESSNHANAKPVNGSVEAIKTLAKDHILFIVTSKPEALEKMTLQWLNKHFPKMFRGVYFTNHFHGGEKRNKADVCKELGIQVFIDDSLEYVKNISSDAAIPVLLFDAPWNQEPVKSPINRVYSWAEIVDWLERGE